MRLGIHQCGHQSGLIVKARGGAGVKDFSHHLSANDVQTSLSSSDLSLSSSSTFTMAYWTYAT